jgi:hypothetical protein
MISLPNNTLQAVSYKCLILSLVYVKNMGSTLGLLALVERQIYLGWVAPSFSCSAPCRCHIAMQHAREAPINQ